MKKNGFTLIELLAIIIVLSGIFTLVAPQINKTITNRKIKQFNELATSVENASKLYVSSHYDVGEDVIPEYVLLSDLTNENFLDSPLVDPRSGTEFNPDTLVTIVEDPEGVFVYTFDDDNLLPNVSTATMVSNNSLNNKYARNSHVVTLSITFNKTISNTPTVTIGGRAATVTGSGKTRIATYTIPAGEATLAEGLLSVSISNYIDESSITGQPFSTVSGGSVTYDRTPPSFNSFYIGGAGNPTYVNNRNTLLNFFVVGASQVCISTTTTCSAWELYSVSKPYTLTTGDATKTLYTWFRDSAGNQIGHYNDSVILDTIPPTLTYFYVGGVGNPIYINNRNTTLYFSATDATEMCISDTTSCSTWETYATTRTRALSSIDGVKIVYTWLKDLAGNITATQNDTVILDTTPPTVAYFYIGGTGNPASTINVNTSVYSNVSGATEMCISTTTSCTAWEAYAATKAITLSAGFGTKSVNIWYRDIIGNTTSIRSDSIEYISSVHDTQYAILTSGYSYSHIDYWMPRNNNESNTIIQGFGTTYPYNYHGVLYFKDATAGDVNAFPAIKTKNSTHQITRIVISVKARYNSSGVYLYVGKTCPPINFATGPRYFMYDSPKPIEISNYISSGAVVNTGYATWTIEDPAWIAALLSADSQCFFIRRDGNASVKNYWEGLGKYDSDNNETGFPPTMTITWTARQ